MRIPSASNWEDLLIVKHQEVTGSRSSNGVSYSLDEIEKVYTILGTPY